MTNKKNNRLRAILSAITAVGLMTSLTACNTESLPSTNSPASITGNATLSAVEEDSSPKSTNDHAENKPIYDDLFKGINSTYVKAPDMTYDDVMEMLAPDEGHPEWDADSFYLVETVKVLTLDECRELAGWDDNYADRVMYKVNILKDLISGEDENRTATIFVSMGNVEWQDRGDPIYAPGDRFTVVLAKPYEGCDFLRTPCSFAFRYDVVEDDSSITLYSRQSELDQLNLAASVSLEESVITSTTKNPAVYSQKIELTTLVDFLRSDWEQREISSHYEREVS